MTITQIAQTAGVSISTVSRYLKGTLHVQPETAQRIDSAAKTIGYTPKLKENKSRYLALVIPSLTNPFYSSLADEIVRLSLSRDYQIDIKVTQGENRREELIVNDLIKNPTYSGVLYAGLNNRNDSLQKVIAKGIDLVLLDERIEGQDEIHTKIVTVDNFSGAYQAVSYLISLGHTNIACLSGPLSLSTSQERLRGYSAALSSSKITYDEEIIFSGPYTEEFGSSILPYLIESPKKPTAIFCSSDISAVGLIGAAEQYGISIPDDLSVVGCDGINFGQWLKPQLTTLKQPIDEIAKSALDLLEADSPQSIQLPLSLIIRNSAKSIK